MAEDRAIKLFITGACGFVGATAARIAIEQGHEVTAAIRPGSPAPRLEGVPATIVEADLRDGARLAEVLASSRPEVVIHLGWAGVANSARFDREQITANVESACGLLEAAHAAGAKKFIGFGSQAEYGPLNRRIDENDRLEPTTLYGAAKVATCYLTRQLAGQLGLDFAWMRLFSTYGPRDNPHWLIPMLIREMLEGRRPKTTLGTQFWDYLFVDDVVRGALAVATTPAATGIFNLGSGRPVQVRAIVERIRDLIAPELELVFGEIPFRPDQVMLMEADVTRLMSLTGWSPQVDMDEGIGRTVAAMRAATGT